MDKLQTLIDKIYPHGVTYSKIGDVATIERGHGLQKSDFIDSGCPCIHYGQIFTEYDTFACETKSYTSEEVAKKLKKVHPGDLIMAVATGKIANVCKCIAWMGEKYVVTGGHTIIIRPKINPMYLSYWFQTDDFYQQKIKLMTGTTVKDVSAADISNVTLPIPDIETQERIVSILDAFAELAGREKQYKYYLNNFYSPEYLKSKRVSLKDIADIERGHGLQKSDFVDHGYPCIHYGQIFTEYNTFACETKSYTSDEVASKLKKVHPGNLIMAITSENFKTVGKCIAWMGKEDIVTSGDTAIIRLKSEVNPMYLSYWFQTDDFYKQKIKLITGTTVKRISRADIANVILPVPDIKIQNNIVEKLNKFHKYCTCLISGLPAEIERREKQYKYYLNKIFNQSEISDTYING